MCCFPDWNYARIRNFYIILAWTLCNGWGLSFTCRKNRRKLSPAVLPFARSYNEAAEAKEKTLARTYRDITTTPVDETPMNTHVHPPVPFAPLPAPQQVGWISGAGHPPRVGCHVRMGEGAGGSWAFSHARTRSRAHTKHVAEILSSAAVFIR